ncbi:MAG: SPOR domain-containing protein [Chitinophagales bacterium]
MKDLFQSFFYALVVGLVAFCFIVLIDRNIGSIQWNNNTEKNDRLKKEADKYADNLDKMVEKSLDVYDKVVNDGKGRRKKTTTPPPPKKQTESTEIKDNTKTVADKPATTDDTKVVAEKDDTSPFENIQSTSSNSATSGYQIQVGVLVKNTDLTPYNSLHDLGKLKTQTINREAKRILLGDFATRGIAEEMLDEVRGLGFSDAFIVSKPPKQAKPTIAENKTPPTTTATSSNVGGKGAYMIQLSAMREPRPQLFSHLREYGNIYKEYDATRQLTKIQLGPFNNETAANQTLAQVKQKGLNTVFLKKVTQTDMNKKVKVYSQL